jgi:glyoxylase-like metal-dependent hydrolase (beta-lactamase superfamily II)
MSARLRDNALPTRAQFLAGLGAALAGGAGPVAAPPWKGRPDSRVKRWDVVTIGNLSRNRYWGEADDKPVRSVLCTCTLVSGEGFRLLVDPAVADAAQMAKELDRRTGRKPRDVTAVFVTHEHGDHYAGLAHFPDATWYASAAVAEILNRTAKLPRQIEPAPARLFDAIDVVATPGHTAASNSVRFDCDSVSVVVAGDAVATGDFFRDRRPFYNAVNVEQSKRTMDDLAAMADVIVPGHDNYFLVAGR